MMEIAFGINFGSVDDLKDSRSGHHDHEHDAAGNCQKPSSTSSQPKAGAPPPPPPPPQDDEDEEAREVQRRKAEAIKQKEAGNEAYKQKNFSVAIDCYNKAMELDNSDISFLTNRSDAEV